MNSYPFPLLILSHMIWFWFGRPKMLLGFWEASKRSSRERYLNATNLRFRTATIPWIMQDIVLTIRQMISLKKSVCHCRKRTRGNKCIFNIWENYLLLFIFWARECNKEFFSEWQINHFSIEKGSAFGIIVRIEAGIYRPHAVLGNRACI